MAKTKIISILKFTVLAVCILFTILALQLYFQQDEWHSFGIILGYGHRYLTFDQPLWKLLLFDRIGARAFMYALFSIFGTNGTAFGLASILLHTFNTFLVYRLSKMLTKQTTSALVAGFLFFVCVSGHQAYTWLGTFAGTVPSVTFMLLSLLYFLYSREQKRSRLSLFLSLFFAILSFFFKETFWFFGILYPLWWFIYTKKRTIGGFIRNNAAVILAWLAITAVFAVNIISIPGDRANYIAPDSSGIKNIIIRSLAYPFEGLSQVFIPYQILFPAAQILTRIVNPQLTPETSEFDAYYQTTAAESVSIFASFFIVGLGYLFIKRASHRISGSTIRTPAAWILFLLLSFLPYIVLAKFDAYLDSRYYYGPAVGAAILAGICTSIAYELKSKNARKTVFTILGIILILHTWFTTTELINQARLGNIRKNILRQVTTIVPTLYPKTVFFVTGNTPGYYGLPELKVPFQSGLGHVLMAVYALRGQLDSMFLQETTLTAAKDIGFLYDTLGEGYRTIGNQGFGYYWNEDNLTDAIKNRLFSDNDVIRLFYDSDTSIVTKL